MTPADLIGRIRTYGIIEPKEDGKIRLRATSDDWLLVLANRDAVMAALRESPLMAAAGAIVAVAIAEQIVEAR